jgi:hypothetical protein
MRDWAAARERAGVRHAGDTCEAWEEVGEPIAESAREHGWDVREKLRADVGE